MISRKTLQIFTIASAILSVELVQSKIFIHFNSDLKEFIDDFGDGVSSLSMTDDERAAFHLTDEEIKSLFSNRYSGNQPESVFIKNNTPWGEVNSNQYWDQLRRVVTVHYFGQQVLSENTIDLEVASHECDRRSHKIIVCKFGSVDLMHHVTHTRSPPGIWNLAGQITYIFESDPREGPNNVKMEYNSESWQQTYQRKVVQTYKTTSAKIVHSMSPGKKVMAKFIAQKSSINLKIPYQATPTGYILGHYPDVDDLEEVHRLLMEKRGSAQVIYFYETVLLEFLRPYRIKIYDPESLQAIKEITWVPDSI